MVTPKPRLGWEVRLASEAQGSWACLENMKFVMEKPKNRAEKTSFKPEPLNHPSKW